MLPNMSLVDEIIECALNEDIGTGDVTTNSIIPAEATTTGFIHTKEDGILAGLPFAKRVFEILCPQIDFISNKMDGDKITAGDILATVSGPAREILTGERVALNILQRMSGIATRTAKLADIVTFYNSAVVDTRKTTPGLRIIEKYAVRIGGGKNHRFGLYDGILIKDNHIKVAGGIRKAISLARANAPHTLKVEVEVEDIAGVNEALEARADIIMLDNMDFDTIKEAVNLIDGRALVEVSGGITEENILSYAKLGVNIISVGALTHSVKSLDISLDVKEIKS